MKIGIGMEITRQVNGISESGGNDSYTKLLLHMDGTNGSTTFIDSSSSARTVSVGADAQISTAQSVFGGASGLFDGTGDRLSVPDSTDWATGTGNFTVDFRARFVNADFTGVFFAQAVDASHYWRLAHSSDATTITLTKENGGSGDISMSWLSLGLVIDTWYHIALVRNGDSWNLYIDGVDKGTKTDSNSIIDFAAVFLVGGDTVNGQYHNGYIDEFRFSNGIARWTTGFTPPTEAYS
jgi:hypothetical protein